MACSKKTKCLSSVVVATIFLLIGIILLVAWPIFFRSILKAHLSLGDNTEGYDMWKETPIPMHLDVYLFNWTNAKEVVEKKFKIKPIVEELGPYVFTEHHVRVNVTWNKNDTISFRQIRTWHFVPELSKGSLDDKVTNFNVIAATVGYFVRHKHILIRRAVDFIMREKNESLYITKTARELIFDGYEDKLLDLLRELNNTAINVPFKKFGWFVERNESYTFDGLFTMYTGEDDVENLGMMTRWNGYSHVPYYSGVCGDVIGTTGEMWPPVVGNSSIYMFSSDMCSTAILDYSTEAELHGVEGVRYSGSERTFDNGTKFKEQQCFAVGEAAPTGLRNVSECRFGAPAFLSFPHFYLTDPDVQGRVQGLKPNKTLHELYLDIEPNTGLPLNVRARAQINILIQPIQGIKMYENVHPVFMPMLWFTQRATLTEEYASQIKILSILPKIGLYTGIGFVCLSGLLFFVILGITWRKQWSKNEGEKLISADSTTTLVT